MADHNKQTVCSIEEMASEIYEMSPSLGEYASESVCNIIYCTVSISCSSSVWINPYIVQLEGTKKCCMFGTLKQIIVQGYVLSSEGIKNIAIALPPGKTRYPLYRRPGGPQGWSGQVENLIPTGIFFNYNFIDPSVHKYNGCMEDISILYC